MHSRHAEYTVEILYAWSFWNSRNIYVSTKLTLGAMGLKDHTFSRACDPHTHC